jgi:hypothetical protein
MPQERSMAKTFFLSLVPLATVALSAPASAQTTATAPICPARYEIMTGNLCIHVTTGDVVFAAAPGRPAYTSADCRKGYEHMVDNLCIHPKSGDVVFANERPTFATTSCRAGYEFLVNGLCFNRTSGDIVFSEVQSGALPAAVKK